MSFHTAARLLLRQGLLLSCFTLWAGLALFRPLAHAATHVPGRFVTDYFHFHWNMWWIRHAITTPDLSIYETNYVLTPFTSNLAYHTLTPFWFPLWAALEPVTGSPAAFDVIFLAGLALTGWCFYLWMRQEGVEPGFALVGAVAFELAPVMLYFVYWSNIGLLGWFWIPAHIVLWAQVADRAAHRWQGWLLAAAQGILLWAMGLVDLQYFIYATPLLIPFGVLTLVRAEGWPNRARLAGMGTLALAICAALLWVAGPLATINDFDRDALVPPDIETTPAVAFPRDYVNLNPDFPVDPDVGVYLLPLFLLSLAVYGTPLRKHTWHNQDRRWFWLALAVVPWVLSLGASITVLGQEIQLPFRLLFDAFDGILRFPMRFSPIFIMPVIIFIALTWQPLLTARGLRLAVLAGLLLVVPATTNVLHPMDVRAVPPVYDFYETMGAEDYDYAVIEVPVAAGTGEQWYGDFADIETQYYGTVHGKRMVNGIIARAPLDYYWYIYDSDPLLAWLGQRKLLEPAVVEQTLRERISGWPIGYIVVHQDRIGLDSPTNQEIIGYFNSLPDLLCPFAVDGPAVAFRTTWHPDGCPPRTPPETQPGVYRIDIGNADDVRYLGAGWHWPEQVFDISLRWSGHQPQATLYVDLPPGVYTVTINAQAYATERQLQLLVNDIPVGDPVTVPTDPLTPLTFDVPADAIGSGQYVTFTLAYDGRISPAEAEGSGDQRQLALFVDWIEFARQ
ncbi:MAG: hypothetical protein GYB65_22965 [Chloroflexi bacterium]|nr:hypothetical protein [Chloroflexota bacterium]